MAIGLALFFPVVLEALIKIPIDNVDANPMILKWGVVIAALITNYVFVEIVKEKQSFRSVLGWASNLLLILIALFAPVLYILAASQTSTITIVSINIGVFAICAWGIILIPILILALLFGNALRVAWNLKVK